MPGLLWDSCYLGDERGLEVDECLEFFPQMKCRSLAVTDLLHVVWAHSQGCSRSKKKSVAVALLLQTRRYLLQFESCTRNTAWEQSRCFWRGDSLKQWFVSNWFQPYCSSYKCLLSFLVQYARKMLTANLPAVHSWRKNKKGDFL